MRVELREAALTRACPECGMPAGTRCRGKRAFRRSVHAARIPPRPYWIYALADPLSGEVVYVGRSGNPAYRYEEHLLSTENVATSRWISGLARRGLLPLMVPLETLPAATFRSAIDKEREWIRNFRDLGYVLLNDPDEVLAARRHRHNQDPITVRAPMPDPEPQDPEPTPLPPEPAPEPEKDPEPEPEKKPE